jgi:hypothetical protein
VLIENEILKAAILDLRISNTQAIDLLTAKSSGIDERESFSAPSHPGAANGKANCCSSSPAFLQPH